MEGWLGRKCSSLPCASLRREPQLCRASLTAPAHVICVRLLLGTLRYKPTPLKRDRSRPSLPGQAVPGDSVPRPAQQADGGWRGRLWHHPAETRSVTFCTPWASSPRSAWPCRWDQVWKQRDLILALVWPWWGVKPCHKPGMVSSRAACQRGL